MTRPLQITFGDKNRKAILAGLLLLACFIFVSANSFSQVSKEQLDPASQRGTANEANVYQNQQRALHLLLMKSEIKNLEEAQMRGFLRLAIIRFIFENDVRKEFDSAETISIDFFEDMAKNSDQFTPESSVRWGNQLIAVIRLKSPDFAKRLEMKYLSKTDMSVADLTDLQNGAKQSDIANRTIAKIAKGEVSDYVLSIHNAIRPVDPISADRILSALLSFFESVSDIGKYGPMLDFIGGNYSRPDAPSELKKRYFQFVVNLARDQVDKAAEGQTAQFILRTLKSALPQIQDLIPSLFTEAQSIFLVLDTRLNKNNRDREEIYARINASDDKLQQIIAEAEATKDKKIKDWLWAWAARLALEKKKFRLAVDMAMKGEVDLDGIQNGRDRFLCGYALEAMLKEKDFELADYTIRQIDNDFIHGTALLIAAKALVDVEDSTQAFEKLSVALRLFEKSDPDPESVYRILGIVPASIKIEKHAGFDVASRGLKIAGRIPTPNPEDRIGTPVRDKYINLVLLPVAFSIQKAFAELARSDVSLAESLSQEIKSRNWRLVAEAVVESERKYLLPLKATKVN